MAKKNKAKFPKRIVGVKIPKRFRRFADSLVGANIVAAGVLYGAYKAANSDTAKRFVTQIREQMARADEAMMSFAERPRKRDYNEERRSAAN